MKTLMCDIETYQNYFLVGFLEYETDKTLFIEKYNNHELNTGALNNIMNSYIIVGFNLNGYDLPIIQAAIEGWTNQSLFNFSQKIIKSNTPIWKIMRTNQITIPKNWNTVDIMNVSPGIASLKLYGARLNCPSIQDLPLPPDQPVDPTLFDELKSYNKNDLAVTKILYNTLKPQIDLRVSMSEQYGLDLRSKSDPQVAETVIAKELKKKTGRKYKPLKLKNDTTIQYQNPKIISFNNPELNRIFNKLLTHEFKLNPNGSIKLPPGLKDLKINIGKSRYQMGIGGLHSCEKAQLVSANDNEILVMQDVSSFYPNIILGQKLSPKTMGKAFLELYQTIVTRRLKAKAAGDKVGADSGKLQINGSFGKLGSKYSILYAPELLLSVTLTGQLTLLMLIQNLEDAGISVVSANTDGILIHTTKDKEREMEIIVWNWMLCTSFEMEREDYTLVASRDVNSYFGLLKNGKVKRKGCFAPNSLRKNPDRQITYDAVINFLKEGKPIEDTIRECKDITKFLSARKVTGGALFNGELLGKTVRFYSSNDTILKDDPAIYYVLSKNKVPKSGGCRPLMELGVGMPDDLDYEAYESDAEKLLKEIGYAS